PCPRSCRGPIPGRDPGACGSAANPVPAPGSRGSPVRPASPAPASWPLYSVLPCRPHLDEVPDLVQHSAHRGGIVHLDRGLMVLEADCPERAPHRLGVADSRADLL